MKKLIALPLLLGSILFTTQVYAQESDDEVEGYVDEHELAHNLHELETPISTTVNDNEINIIAYELVVTRQKFIELHIFYDIVTDGEPGSINIQDIWLNAEQDGEPVPRVMSMKSERGDDFDPYRTSLRPGETPEGDAIPGMSYFYLRDYETPVDIYSSSGGLSFLSNVGDSILTIDISEILEYDDTPDEAVEAPEGEDIIETNNVFLEIVDYAVEDDLLYVTYNVTPKTLYNSIGMIDYQYITVAQQDGFNASTVLSTSWDTENEDGESYLDYHTDHLEPGETVEVTKVMELEDKEKPHTLEIREIVTNEVYYEEELDLGE